MRSETHRKDGRAIHFYGKAFTYALGLDGSEFSQNFTCCQEPRNSRCHTRGIYSCFLPDFLRKEERSLYSKEDSRGLKILFGVGFDVARSTTLAMREATNRGTGNEMFHALFVFMQPLGAYRPQQGKRRP